MKIAVLGAGAMGSVFGARLAMAGYDVVLLDVNQAHLDAINQNGLTVTLDGETSNVAIAAMRPEAFIGGVDLVLLFTKTFHTAEALGGIQSKLDDAFVFSLQNGVGNAERLAAALDPDRILLGMTLTPADFIAPGQVASHGEAHTAFYTLSGEEPPILQEINTAFERAGITAKIDPDVMVTIWEKAAFNCALNALCALTNATPGAVGKSAQGRALASKVAAEVVAVANAKGINADLERVEATMTHACATHLDHEPSMLQDIKGGRKTEIDALNGAIVGAGIELGIATPHNQQLADLINLAETANTFVRGK